MNQKGKRINLIRTEQEHLWILAEAERLMALDPGVKSADFKRLVRLAGLIEAYQKRTFAAVITK